MSLDDLLTRGWDDHAGDAAGVFDRLVTLAERVASPADALAYARLVAHVGGEHLGRFTEAVALIEGVASRAGGEAPTAESQGVHRLLAALHRCAGDTAASARHLVSGTGEAGEASARIRVLAQAAAMQVGQGRLQAGGADLEAAVALAEAGLAQGDPAVRDLAVAGNNLACGLEEAPALDDTGRALMLRAARIARRFWAVAGGWMQVERAEYRLCMSHLKAGAVIEARAHGEACLQIVRENGGDPGESFFAHEACARAAHAAGDLPAAVLHFEAASDALAGIDDAGFRGFCDATLATLGQTLGRD
jgi:hypothetical protein